MDGCINGPEYCTLNYEIEVKITKKMSSLLHFSGCIYTPHCISGELIDQSCNNRTKERLNKPIESMSSHYVRIILIFIDLMVIKMK